MAKNGAGYDPDIEDVWPVEESEEEISIPTREELGMRKISKRAKINLTQIIIAIVFIVLWIVGINFIGYVLDIPGGLFN